MSEKRNNNREKIVKNLNVYNTEEDRQWQKQQQ